MKRPLSRDIQQQDRLDLQIWIVTFIGFLNTTGISLSLPFLALYLHQQRGIPMTMVGFIVLISGIGSAVSQLFGGALTDRLGRKPLIGAAAVAHISLFTVMAVQVEIAAPVWSIVIMNTAGHAAMALSRPATQAMVVDVSSPKVLTRAYGVLRVGTNLGWAAGPAIGGYLLVFLPYSWLFGITASLSAINLVFVIFLLRESHGRDSGITSIGKIITGLHDKRFLVFIVICLLLFLVMGQMVSTLSVFTVDRAGFSTPQYGLLLTTNGLIVVVLQYPSTLITGKIRRSTALLFGCLAYAIGYCFMGWITGFWVAVLAMVIITIGEIIFSPVSLSVVGEISPPAFRGRYLALFGLSEGLGFSLASLIGGALLDVFPSEGRLVWGTIAAIAVIAGLGFFFWGKLPLDNRLQYPSEN